MSGAEIQKEKFERAVVEDIRILDIYTEKEKTAETPIKRAVYASFKKGAQATLLRDVDTLHEIKYSKRP
jgi:hypothetical protein